jgi:hypothetical protein
MSKYQKRHYEDMAVIIYDGQQYAAEWDGHAAKISIDTIKKSMIQLFEADNKDFNKKIFENACNGIRRRK